MSEWVSETDREADLDHDHATTVKAVLLLVWFESYTFNEHMTVCCHWYVCYARHSSRGLKLLYLNKRAKSRKKVSLSIESKDRSEWCGSVEKPLSGNAWATGLTPRTAKNTYDITSAKDVKFRSACPRPSFTSSSVFLSSFYSLPSLSPFLPIFETGSHVTHTFLGPLRS